MKYLLSLVLAGGLLISNLAIAQPIDLSQPANRVLKAYVSRMAANQSMCPDPVHSRLAREKLSAGIKLALSQAKRGDANAAYEVGMASAYIVPADNNPATYWLKKSAAKGNLRAMYQLGFWQYANSGGNQSSKAVEQRGLALMHKAAKLGDSQAQVMLGFLALGNNQPKRAYQLALAAKKKDPRAYVLLGDLYFQGAYVKKNLVRAFNYYHQAIKQSSKLSDAMNQQVLSQLSLMYSHGLGAKKNLGLAKYYAHKLKLFNQQAKCR